MSTAKLMVMAGGTGGHVFPALAVAKALQTQEVDVVWLGTKKGLEARVVPEHAIPINWISVEGLRGKSKLSWLLAPFSLARAIWQSMQALRLEKPNCVLGMGGFASGPGAIAARLMGKRLVIHEQNAVAGLTNKYLAKIAHRVLSGFPQVVGLPDRTEWVGNPVRDTIKPSARQASEPLRVLVVGGSQGAYSFNHYLPALFAQLNADKVLIEIWHQTGHGNAQSTLALYKEQSTKVKVSEFIDDMAAAYEWADLLVCRAGAMTIAECCAAAKPALFVPYPFSAGDHQDFNAQALVDGGAAKAVPNSALQDGSLLPVLQAMLSEPEKLALMGERASALHKSDALASVAGICKEMCYA